MTPFDIVLLPFPFSDLSASKKRPCLVLVHIKPKHLGAHLLVSMITSNIQGLGFPYDVSLRDWKVAGLPKESLVRVSKLVTIECKLVVKTLGKLSKFDSDGVRDSLRKFLGNAI